jgi:hypothetical protein
MYFKTEYESDFEQEDIKMEIDAFEEHHDIEWNKVNFFKS